MGHGLHQKVGPCKLMAKPDLKRDKIGCELHSIAVKKRSMRQVQK